MPALVPLRELSVVTIGEVLWDELGIERHLGGATLNFAYHARALGAPSYIISRVGTDALGDEAIKGIERLGVSTQFVQRDPINPTGTVTATVDATGSADYLFPPSVAWDHIEYEKAAEKVINDAAIIAFGSLAQRGDISKKTIRDILEVAPPNALCVLDLNIRPPYFNREVVDQSFQFADVVKINTDELQILRQMYGLSKSTEESVKKLMNDFDIATFIVTDGGDGAEAWNHFDHAKVPGLKVNVCDTIGCGDAFAAAFALRLAAGASLKESLQLGNLAGAYLATQQGATPPVSVDILRAFEARLREGQ